jgi:nucleoside-diphosphate-sugar epimerase
MQRVFVTGGSGFVGLHLLRRLQKEGIRAYALSRSADSDKVISQFGAVPIRGDLHDRDALHRGTADVDTIFHLAASVDFWKRAASLWNDHVNGTLNVISAAISNKVGALIYLGASSVIMNGKPIIDANEDFQSDNIIDGYSQTKLVAEQKVLSANSETLKTISIRPPLIWGKGSPVISRIKHAVETGRFRFINGGAHQFVTCHVENVVEALMLAAVGVRGGKAYFVTDGERLEFRKFITDVLVALKADVKAKSTPLHAARIVARAMDLIWRIFQFKEPPPLYPGMVNITGLPFIISDERARRELGYRPVISVAEGLEQMKSQ